MAELSSSDIVSGLFHPVPERFRPFYSLWQTQSSLMWSTDTMLGELKIDSTNWPRLPQQLRTIVYRLALYFAIVDKFAGEIAAKMSTFRFTETYIVILFAIATHIEGVHADMYSRFIDMFIKTEDRADIVQREILKLPAITSMLEWGKTYANNSGNDIRPIIIGALCYEGIMVRTFFAIPCAMKAKENILPGFIKGNEFVGRDEWQHVLNWVALYHYVINHDSSVGSAFGKLPDKRVHAQIIGAVNIAEAALDEMIECDLPQWNINRNEIKQVARFTANTILDMLGCELRVPTTMTRLPDYMQTLNAMQFTSFHTTVPTEYKQVSKEEDFDMAAIYGA